MIHLAELAFTPSVGRECESHRSVRFEAEQHRRPEPTLTDFDAIAAERAAERIKEALPQLRRGRRREIGPATVASVAVEGELRHGERHPPDLRERPLHSTSFFEDAEIGDLRGQAFAVLGAVALADPEEYDDTRLDFGDALVTDVDRGRANPLNDRAR
jgi:hypothetical protein